jgi:hypothetical protein
MPRGPSLRSLGILAATAALMLSGISAAAAHGPGNVYKKRNLVSDIDGVARITDPNLVNPWGLAAGRSLTTAPTCRRSIPAACAVASR